MYSFDPSHSIRFTSVLMTCLQASQLVYNSDSQPGATWPPRGKITSLGGGDTEHLGNWGGMGPFGGNQQIAINRPGCSSGWRIVAASPVFVDVTL